MHKVFLLTKKVFYQVSPWPFLIPIAGALLCVLIFVLRPDALILQKPFLETVALILTGACFAVTAFRVKIEDNLLIRIFCLWTFIFFCREIHFAYTSDGVYIAALAIAIWIFIKRDALVEPLYSGSIKTWILTSSWAYFLAILVQRRFFKHLPLLPDAFYTFEHDIHVELEEFLEVVAHGILLVTTFCGFNPARLRHRLRHPCRRRS